MKKYTTTLIATCLVGLLTGCAASSQPKMESFANLDSKKLCNIDANGIEKVITTAKKYNEIAKEKGLEFRRLTVNNSDLIISVEEAIKTGAKEVNPKTFKGKKSKTILETNYAAQRACKFAIAALTQAEEAKTSWRLAVPGDGYKY